MMLSEADAKRLAVAGHDRAVFSFVDSEGFLKLRNTEGHCVFLASNGRCSVHAIRPAGCRLYPLVYDEKWGPVMDVDCPWTREFVQTPDNEEALLRLVGTLVSEQAQRRSGRLPIA